MIIDFHTHILPPVIKANRARYLAKDAAFAAIYSSEKAVIATVEDLISSMDRNGIDISVIVNYSWTTVDFCVETNNYILDAVTKYPKRLVGFCSVHSLTDDNALKEIERCAKAGAKGLGELRIDALYQNGAQQVTLAPLADTLLKTKFMVLVHSSEPIGHRYPGKGSATPDMLYKFINELNDICVICAHWGGGLPFYDLMPEVQSALESVYYDTAASPFLYQPEIYNVVAQLAGSDRILFGSDYPLMPQSRIINEIRDSGLSGEDCEEILSTNARRLLRI